MKSPLYDQTSKEKTIVLDGYACNIGEVLNDHISKERAKSVKAAFIEYGVDISKISIH